MNSIKCPQCGLVNWTTAEACKRCRLPINEMGATEGDTWDESSSSFSGEPASHWGDQGAYQQPSYSYAGSGQVAQKTGLAIASMVVGIVSMMACGLLGLGSITGLVLGIVALVKAKKSPLSYGGQGFAVAGIVLSVVSFFYIGIVIAIAIPNVMASYRAANEGSAIATLRSLAAAEANYQDMAGPGKYGTLQELAAAGMIDPKLSGGVKNNYRFEVRTNGAAYEALATPLKDNDLTGRSFYFSSNDYVIRAAKKGGAAATASDPPLNVDQPPQSSQTVSREGPLLALSPAN